MSDTRPDTLYNNNSRCSLCEKKCCVFRIERIDVYACYICVDKYPPNDVSDEVRVKTAIVRELMNYIN